MGIYLLLLIFNQSYCSDAFLKYLLHKCVTQNLFSKTNAIYLSNLLTSLLLPQATFKPVFVWKINREFKSVKNCFELTHTSCKNERIYSIY